jgi:hypothetical protein
MGTHDIVSNVLAEFKGCTLISKPEDFLEIPARFRSEYSPSLAQVQTSFSLDNPSRILDTFIDERHGCLTLQLLSQYFSTNGS